MIDVLRWTGRVLVLLVIGSAARIGAGLLSSSRRPGDLAASPRRVASVPGLASERPVDSLVRVIRGTGLFRWEAPAPPTGPDPSAAPESRPALSISAVVGGQSPGVVLEGIPGIDGGRLVRSGDTIGGLRVRWVKGHQAGVTSRGSTWTVSLRSTP